jgi:alkanesulfonate monooxygenase SsuD/methylene tetrahydromethanopterin reductase-like flavin-dependent oxidoreductase (luciferase family)
VDFRVFVEPQQGATYSDQLAVARAAESLDYSAFFRSDHYVAMSGDGLPGPTDSWVTLAGIARETSSIRLGTMVTSATFRHPGPLAVSVAQVDEMSGGRAELVSAALTEAGRKPDSLTYSAAFVVCAGRDDAEIARRAAAIGREVDELRSNSPTVGTPAEIADKLGPYIDVGVQRVYLQLLDMSDLDHLEFFATEVVPQFG